MSVLVYTGMLISNPAKTAIDNLAMTAMVLGK